MQLNNLKRKNKNKKHRTLGRGGKHAKTSGRGGKGQTARAGNKRRPQMRDIIKKIPKKRGYRFNSPHPTVNVDLEKMVPGKEAKNISFKETRKKLGIKGSKIIFKK